MADSGMDAFHRVQQLEKQAMSLATKNDRLTKALSAAREQLQVLQEQLADMTRPPATYATVLGTDIAAREADVLSSGRKLRVAVAPSVPLGALHVGQEVQLNESMMLIKAGAFNDTGELVAVKEVLDAARILVVGRSDDEFVLRMSGPLAAAGVRIGDTVTADLRNGIAIERIERTEVSELLLEETPDVDYRDIGGLGPQIEQIRDAVELPFNHPELYREHGLKPPKGVLLYGPPGCGKTLIAKAVANSLATSAAQRDAANGQPTTTPRSYFLNIKGPELLNKFVGETERQIRTVFARAREKASSGVPVIVFFDEMESLFRTRGSGLSSDVETTVVPQLLSEIDGVEKLENVIIIGASNREDMIDPAILRPGRLDVKIKIERPDPHGAGEIFAKYLTTDLPIHRSELDAHHADAQRAVQAMIDHAVTELYGTDKDKEFLEVPYASGDKEVLYFKAFAF